jgi:hypothetical protein
MVEPLEPAAPAPEGAWTRSREAQDSYQRALAAFDEGDRKARLEEVSALTLYVRSIAIIVLERWRTGQ